MRTILPGPLAVGEIDTTSQRVRSVARNEPCCDPMDTLHYFLGSQHRNHPSLFTFATRGRFMNPILFLSLVFILAAALPWWPYSAYGRARHHHPWDWLFDNPSFDDIKNFDRQHEAIGRGSTNEATQKAVRKPCYSDSETYRLRRQFEALAQTKLQPARTTQMPAQPLRTPRQKSLRGAA